jgi:hypothetical protein
MPATTLTPGGTPHFSVFNATFSERGIRKRRKEKRHEPCIKGEIKR